MKNQIISLMMSVAFLAPNAVFAMEEDDALKIPVRQATVEKGDDLLLEENVEKEDMSHYIGNLWRDLFHLEIVRNIQRRGLEHLFISKGPTDFSITRPMEFRIPGNVGYGMGREKPNAQPCLMSPAAIAMDLDKDKNVRKGASLQKTQSFSFFEKSGNSTLDKLKEELQEEIEKNLNLRNKLEDRGIKPPVEYSLEEFGKRVKKELEYLVMHHHFPNDPNDILGDKLDESNRKLKTLLVKIKKVENPLLHQSIPEMLEVDDSLIRKDPVYNQKSDLQIKLKNLEEVQRKELERNRKLRENYERKISYANSPGLKALQEAYPNLPLTLPCEKSLKFRLSNSVLVRYARLHKEITDTLQPLGIQTKSDNQPKETYTIDEVD